MNSANKVCLPPFAGTRACRARRIGMAALAVLMALSMTPVLARASATEQEAGEAGRNSVISADGNEPARSGAFEDGDEPACDDGSARGGAPESSGASGAAGAPGAADASGTASEPKAAGESERASKPACALPFTVEGAGHPSLASAFAAASSVLADTPACAVEVKQVGDCVVEEQATVVVPPGKTVRLNGFKEDGATGRISIGGAKDFSMVRVEGGGALELAGVTLTGAADEGVAAPRGQLASVGAGSTLRLSDGAVLEKGYAESGGGAYVEEGSPDAESALVMQANARIEACRAKGRGGGVLALGRSSLRLTDTASLLRNEAGADGGGAALEGGAAPVSVVMEGSSSVKGNNAHGQGGGVHLASGSAENAARLSGSACITGNFCEGDGGALGAGLYGVGATVYLEGGLYVQGNKACLAQEEAKLVSSNLAVSEGDPSAVRVTGDLTGAAVGIEAPAKEGDQCAVVWSLEKGCEADASTAGATEGVTSDNAPELCAKWERSKGWEKHGASYEEAMEQCEVGWEATLKWRKGEVPENNEDCAAVLHGPERRLPEAKGASGAAVPNVIDEHTVFSVEWPDGTCLHQYRADNSGSNLFHLAVQRAVDFLKGNASNTEIIVKQWKNYEVTTPTKVSIPWGKTLVIDGQRNARPGSGVIAKIEGPKHDPNKNSSRIIEVASGTLKLTDVTLRGERDLNIEMGREFGVVACEGSNTQFVMSRGSVIEKGFSKFGGGVCAEGRSRPVTIVMEDDACIRDCKATFGGAVCINDYVNLYVKDTASLIRNEAEQSGGAIQAGPYYGHGGSLTRGYARVEMRGASFADGNKGNEGGFIYLGGDGSSFLGTDNASLRNTESQHAAIHQRQGKTKIELAGNFQAVGNHARGVSAVIHTGIESTAASVILNGSGARGVRMTDNTTEGYTGAIFVYITPLQLKGRVTVYNNWTGKKGALSGVQNNVVVAPGFLANSKFPGNILVLGSRLEGTIGVNNARDHGRGAVFASVASGPSSKVSGLNCFFNDHDHTGRAKLVGVAGKGNLVEWGGDPFVSFDANGGAFKDGSTSKKVRLTESVIVSPNSQKEKVWVYPPAIKDVPVRDGYIFTGWYVRGKHAAGKSADELWGTPYDNIAGTYKEYSTTANLCAFARWELPVPGTARFTSVGFDGASNAYRPLPSTTFNVYKWQGSESDITPESINDAAGTVPLAGAAGGFSEKWVPLVDNEQKEAVDGARPTDAPKTFSSADDGTVELSNVNPDAWYMLVQTGTAAGYQVPGGQWAFRVASTYKQAGARQYRVDVGRMLGKQDAAGLAPPAFKTSLDLGSGEVQGTYCVNMPVYALPHTGAPGVLPWLSVAAGLVAAGLIAAVARCRGVRRRLAAARWRRACGGFSSREGAFGMRPFGQPPRARRAANAACALAMAAGLCLALYPVAGNVLYRMTARSAVSSYDVAVASHSQEELDALWDEARAYNGELASPDVCDPWGYRAVLPPLDRYWDVLDPDKTGVMGYVEVPGIGLQLPIYHGTSDEVLEKGAGHIATTALPVGGAGSHPVVTGHTGVPDKLLFTNLACVKPGDSFAVHVLGRTTTYRVSRVDVVDPHDTSLLQPVRGEERFTLLTCTPYGINSHRLLVTGVPCAEEGPVAPRGVPLVAAVWLGLAGALCCAVALALLVAGRRVRLPAVVRAAGLVACAIVLAACLWAIAGLAMRAGWLTFFDAGYSWFDGHVLEFFGL